MKWYWHIAGGHTHVRVFMNGGKCGDLCFLNEEFKAIMDAAARGGMVQLITFIDETPMADAFLRSAKESI